MIIQPKLVGKEHASSSVLLQKRHLNQLKSPLTLKVFPKKAWNSKSSSAISTIIIIIIIITIAGISRVKLSVGFAVCILILASYATAWQTFIQPTQTSSFSRLFESQCAAICPNGNMCEEVPHGNGPSINNVLNAT